MLKADISGILTHGCTIAVVGLSPKPQRDSFEVTMRRRFDQGDAYFDSLSREWGEGTRAVFRQLPELQWP